jgi:hypothetical protein
MRGAAFRDACTRDHDHRHANARRPGAMLVIPQGDPRTMNTSIKRIALSLGLGLLLAGAAAAQSSVAHISGTAKAGDTVLVESVDTGFKREVAVKPNGRYSVRNLPIGTFSVVVKHADGSTDQPKLVTLRVGVTARVPN